MNARPLAAGMVVFAAAAILGEPLIAPVGATERLSLRVSPSLAFAPANLVVKAMVEMNKDNRSIEVVAESDNFYRSSEIPLDGDHAPRTSMFRFSNLPGGTYVVRAVLRGSGRHPIASSEMNLRIVEVGASY